MVPPTTAWFLCEYQAELSLNCKLGLAHTCGITLDGVDSVGA